jgi:hypothetical protein
MINHYDALTEIVEAKRGSWSQLDPVIADAYATVIKHEQDLIDDDPSLIDMSLEHRCEQCGANHRDHDNMRECNAAMALTIDTLEQLVYDLTRRPNGWTYLENERLKRKVRTYEIRLGIAIDEMEQQTLFMQAAA